MLFRPILLFKPRFFGLEPPAPDHPKFCSFFHFPTLFFFFQFPRSFVELRLSLRDFIIEKVFTTHIWVEHCGHFVKPRRPGSLVEWSAGVVDWRWTSGHSPSGKKDTITHARVSQTQTFVGCRPPPPRRSESCSAFVSESCVSCRLC